jgi:hypothetical protein
VKAWFDGGSPVSGALNPAGAFVQSFKNGGGSTWRLYPEGTPKEKKTSIDWKSFGTPFSPEPTTYGYKWNDAFVTRSATKQGAQVNLPEYFRLNEDPKRTQWLPVKPADVPAETQLQAKTFPRPKERPEKPYDTPEGAQTTWKTPGPKAGPFKAFLGDGSVVTYYWYRFADQPALLNADLTPAEREAMQAKVEKLHRAWTKDRDYLAPPTVGKLADLDPAQVVTPPKGLEVGYVPIATRQELATPVPAR